MSRPELTAKTRWFGSGRWKAPRKGRLRPECSKDCLVARSRRRPTVSIATWTSNLACRVDMWGPMGLPFRFAGQHPPGRPAEFAPEKSSLRFLGASDASVQLLVHNPRPAHPCRARCGSLVGAVNVRASQFGKESIAVKISGVACGKVARRFGGAYVVGNDRCHSAQPATSRKE
jgi:hypothetical protein